MKKNPHPDRLFIITACALAALCFSWCLAAGVRAAGITIADFLVTAKSDSLLALQDERTDFLRQAPSNTPFLEEIEFRTQTDEFKASRQSYSLRFYPNGRGKTEADRKEYETTLTSSRLRRDVLFHRALKDRYLIAVDYLHTRETLDLQKKMCAVYEDRLTVLKSYAGNPRFDITDLLKANERLTRQQLDIAGTENKLRRLEQTIFRYTQTTGDILFDASGLPGIFSIGKTPPHSDQMLDSDNVYLKESGTNVTLAQDRYDQKKVSDGRIINFVEVSYDSSKRSAAEDAVALQLGIRIPFISADRLDLNREKLRCFDERARHEALKRYLSENLTLFYGEMQDLLMRYDLIAKQINPADRNGVREIDAAAAAGAEPLTLLQMKENIVQRQLDLSAVSREASIRYVEILDLTGKLSESPLKNYLSTAMEVIDP